MLFDYEKKSWQENATLWGKEIIRFSSQKKKHNNVTQAI